MSDLFGLGGIFQGIGNAVGSFVQAGTQAQVADKNLAFQKENLAYQKGIQQQMFAREDNAVQRRVADLKAAGLSPVLAAGSAAEAGPVVATTAPHQDIVPDIGGAVASVSAGAKNVMDAMTQRADIERTKAQTALDVVQAEKAKIEAAFMEASNPLRIRDLAATVRMSEGTVDYAIRQAAAGASREETQLELDRLNEQLSRFDVDNLDIERVRRVLEVNRQFQQLQGDEKEVALRSVTLAAARWNLQTYSSLGLPTSTSLPDAVVAALIGKKTVGDVLDRVGVGEPGATPSAYQREYEKNILPDPGQPFPVHTMPGIGDTPLQRLIKEQEGLGGWVTDLLFPKLRGKKK